MIRTTTLFLNLSLQSKLILSFGLIISVALTLTLSLSLINYRFEARDQLAQELEDIAHILAANSTAALTFDDEQVATDILSSLHGHSSIFYSELFDKEGRPFSHYGDSDKALDAFSDPSTKGHQFDGQYLTVTSPVSLAGQPLGAIRILAHMDRLHVQLIRQVAISAGIILIAIFISSFLAYRLRRTIAQPVMQLTGLMERVSRERTYSLRAPTGSTDEIGRLALGFNQMLADIETRDQQLAAHQQQLEQKVTERTSSLAEANTCLAQYARVYESTLDGVLILDANQRILATNNAFTHITGYTEAEAIGQKPSLLSSGLHDQGFYTEMWNSITQAGHWRGEVLNRRKDGELFFEELTISANKDEAGEVVNYIGIFSDITALKESRQRLEHLAHYDALTGLPNRLLFSDRIEHAIHSAHRQQCQLALLFIDLDRFKIINDTLGHAAGDILLQEVAKRLQDCVRESDTVARFGGDEFALLLEGFSDPQAPDKLAQKVLDALLKPVALEGQDAFIGGSIGICCYPQDGEDASTLLKHADIAMYQAKQQSGSSYHFYTYDPDDHANKRLSLETDLHQAIERGELELHYQPQIDLVNGRLVGAEALLRWNHPEQGSISPARFIPLAEESGLIVKLTEWVLNTACEQINIWQAACLAVPPIAINISAQQLKRYGLVDMVKAALDQFELEGQRLDIEVTEGMFIQQPALAAQILNELKALGVSISIDDFGTGYSSLAKLKELPLDTLKIDQSFVREIPHEPRDMAISQAVIVLGHSLGLKVIAEGVETEAQQAFLRNAGCDQAQGYLYAKPLPANEFALLMKETSI